MFSNRSPPKHKKLNKGGSSTLLSSSASASSTSLSSTASNATSITPTTSAYHHSAPLKLGSSASSSSTCRGSNTLSLYTNSSTNNLLEGPPEKSLYHHHHGHTHSHSHHTHQHQHHNASSRSTGNGKRGKKQNWGSRERAGMSFLIVIAFFAIFGLIILTELFMIDERSHTGVSMLRHGTGYGTRLGDSMPDYDNVKDYDMLEEQFLVDNKLGYVQLRDNKLKIQDAVNNGETSRLAGILMRADGGGAAAAGGQLGAQLGRGSANVGGGGSGGIMTMLWGKQVPSEVEATLPRYAFGVQPIDGAWQIVKGTRYKFFVFSAYYDRRDNARLVRVIGATKTRIPERVWCRFWYAPRNTSAAAMAAGTANYTSATVMARVKVISENWNLKYSACFVLCPVRTPDLQVPHIVSIVPRLRTPASNQLLVRNTDWDEDFVNATAAAGNVSATLNASAAAKFSAKAPQQGIPTAATVPTGDEIPDKIAICVKPFHFNYDQAFYLMEFLELYALLGVSHFTFYNHTIGPHATCVLEHYMSGDMPGNLTAFDVDITNVQGDFSSAAAAHSNANYNSVNHNENKNNNNNNHNNNSHSNTSQAAAAAIPPPTVAATPTPPTPALKQYTSRHYAKPTINILPWNLRMRSQKEIRTEGLFAALNDCVYRNMYRYKYLALVDLDEFIVPRQRDTINELIKSLNQRFRNRKIGAYSFQNAFFYLQFPDDSLATQAKTPNGFTNARVRAALVTQRKTKRRFRLHPQKQRSKYICKPEAVVEAGNHFVWEFAPGRSSLNVPPTDAILQHYRVCEFGGNDCIKAQSTVDRTATKYVNRLVQRVEMVYNYLKDRCNLDELPTLPNKEKPPQPEESPLTSGDPNANNKASKMRRSTGEEEQVNNMNNESETMGKTTTTTTTTTKAATTKTHATAQNATANSGAQRLNVRKKRKIVVFETDDEGIPRAHVEYVDRGF